MKPYVVLASAWVVYFVLHSALAAPGVKDFARRRMGGLFRFYRLVYVLVATAGLLLLMFFNAAVAAPRFYEESAVTRYFSFFLTTIGVLVLREAFRQYGLRGFLGLAQEKEELRMEGILNYVRHPIYSGIVLISAGYLVFDPRLASVVSVGCIFVYLIVGMRLEEKKLLGQFGAVYEEYRRRVPAVIPRLAGSTAQKELKRNQP